MCVKQWWRRLITFLWLPSAHACRPHMWGHYGDVMLSHHSHGSTVTQLLFHSNHCIYEVTASQSFYLSSVFDPGVTVRWIGALFNPDCNCSDLFFFALIELQPFHCCANFISLEMSLGFYSSVFFKCLYFCLKTFWPAHSANVCIPMAPELWNVGASCSANAIQINKINK